MADRRMRLEIILAAAERFSAPFNKAGKASKDLSKDLRGTRDQLRDLENTQRQLTGFQKLEQDIVSSAQELRKAKIAAAALERQFDLTEKPTKKLTNAAIKAAEAVAKLEGKQREEVARLDQLRTKLSAAGVETGDMARAQDRLKDQVNGANRALEAQQDKLSELAARQKRFRTAGGMINAAGGRAGKALAVGAAAGAGATAIALPVMHERELGNEFESRMTDIGQKAEISRAERAALAGKLLATADKVNQMPQALQDAADTLAGFGLNVPDAVSLSSPVGKAATAYKAEMLDLSAAVFAVHDNLKVAANEKAITQALDIMAYTGKKGAFEIKDMAGALPSLTANYQALGQTGVGAVADLAAALQITRKGAGDSAEAATNLENVLQKIASPETERRFAKMGVNLRDALAKAAKEGKSPIEAIAGITDKTLKGDLSKIGYLFEDAQVQKGLRPLIQNLKEYQTLRAEALSAKNVVASDFDDRMKDGGETDKKAQIALMQARLQFAQALAPMITPLAQEVSKVASGFANWAKAHPKLVGFMAKAAVWIGILLAAVGGIMLIVAPILAFIGALGAAAAALGTTVGVVVGAILAVVGVIVAAIGLVVNAVKAWGVIGPIITQAWNAGIERIRAAVGMITGLASLFMDAGRHLMSGLVQGLRNGLGAVKDAIFDTGSKVVGWFKEKLGIHSPSRVFAGLGGFVMSGLDQGLQRGQGGPLSTVSTIAGRMTDRFQRAAPRLAAQAAGVTALVATSLTAQGAIAAPPVGPRPGPPPAAAPVITINITVQAAPNQDGDALGRVIGGHVSAAVDQALGRHNANAQFEDGYT